MLLTIAVILGVLWLLGVVLVHITGPLLHLVIVIAVIVFVYDLITKRVKK